MIQKKRHRRTHLISSAGTAPANVGSIATRYDQANHLLSCGIDFYWRKHAYDYLGDSIKEFPGDEALLRLMEANGFGDAAAEPLTVWIVTIYTAPVAASL